MAIYREIAQKEVEAVQLIAAESKSTDVAVSHVTLLPYKAETAEAKDEPCSKCGHLMSTHWMRKTAFEYDPLCPVTFVVIDDGVIKYRAEADFATRYEAVPIKEG